MKRWYQSKAIWTGVAGLVAAAGGYLTGEMSQPDALKLGFDALMGIFIRLGVMGAGNSP